MLAAMSGRALQACSAWQRCIVPTQCPSQATVDQVDDVTGAGPGRKQGWCRYLVFLGQPDVTQLHCARS